MSTQTIATIEDTNTTAPTAQDTQIVKENKMETEVTVTTTVEEAATTTTRTLKYSYPEGLTSAQKKAFRRQARRNEKKIQKILASFTEPILPIEAEDIEALANNPEL